MAFAVTIHLLAAVIWVGGMFFAYMALRPVAAAQLEPRPRLDLWAGVFGRFFPWVWISVLVLLGTGYWMVIAIFGGFGSVLMHINIMHGLGLLMVLIYMHVYFAEFRDMKKALAAGEIPAAAARLGRIRLLIAVNLLLGLGVISIASAGRYIA